jgi:hypothetical protein
MRVAILTLYLVFFLRRCCLTVKVMHPPYCATTKTFSLSGIYISEMCCDQCWFVNLQGLSEKFKEKDTAYSGSANFGYETFMLTVLPFLIA